jgi:cyclohexadieny/prephenate dehydrogenase
MFDKICILGCGLIGSSLLRAIHKKKLANKLSAFDKSKNVSLYLAKNFSFHIAKSIEEAVKDSDLVIISSPLSSYKEILLLIKSSLKKNVILTDTGSAKKEINKIINNLNLNDVNWIASHPIAGTEFSGPEAGFAELFEKRWCILSADKNISEKEIQKLEKFWIELGSKVKLMSFEQHDYVLSLTSHLPHAVAYSIVKTAINDDEKFKNDIIQYSAG